jgi:hypothetical protein
MPVSRTIYTQGAASIALQGGFSGFLSGVQSANLSVNEPKQDVNEMGVLGAINKVQLESVSATAEVVCCLTSGNSTSVRPLFPMLTALVAQSKLPNPAYCNVDISGLGQLRSGLLTSFSIEAAVGNIPTITLRFEGRSGNNIAAGSVPTTPNSSTLGVLVPDQVSGIYISGNSVCAQNLRVNWEMPVERMNCLGSPLDAPTLFTRPPGTATVSVEGTTIPGLVTGVDVGPYTFWFTQIRQVSETNNMSVGDAAASFTINDETNGFGLTILEGPSNTNWASLAVMSAGQEQDDETVSFRNTPGDDFTQGIVYDDTQELSVGDIVDFQMVGYATDGDSSGDTFIVEAGVFDGASTFTSLGTIVPTAHILDVVANTFTLNKIRVTALGYPAFRMTTSTGAHFWSLTSVGRIYIYSKG